MTNDTASSGGTSGSAVAYLNLATDKNSYTFPITLATATEYYWEVDMLRSPTPTHSNWSQASFTTAGSPSQTPYWGTPFALPRTIDAEDFDKGGQKDRKSVV